MNGKLIVVDGSNGAGKSTVLAHLASRLRQQGHDIVMTREPGGTALGEAIRELVLDERQRMMAPMTELMLFAAARAQHVNELIRPALARGQIVLSDRFDSASVSFQHYARGLPRAHVTELNRLALDGLVPDLTLVLDLPAEEGLRRNRQRDEADRLEKESLDFLERARQGYLIQAQQAPSRFRVIDARQPLRRVLAASSRAVEAIL